MFYNLNVDSVCNKKKIKYENHHKGALCPPPSYLPVLRDSIPHSNFPCVARGHQLAPNKEEVIHRYAQTEHTWGS